MKKKNLEMKKQKEKNYFFKPRLNNSKLKIKRSVKDLLKWKKDKDFKITEKRIRKEKSETLKNRGNKINKGKRVHCEERFYDLNSKPGKSLSPVKPVGERLYDYRIIYEKRRKEREEEIMSKFFKPNFISNNRDGVLAKTDSRMQTHLKKEEVHDFINLNKNHIKKKKFLTENFTDGIHKNFILDKKNNVNLKTIFEKQEKKVIKKKLVFAEKKKKIYKPNNYYKDKSDSEEDLKGQEKFQKEAEFEIMRRNFEAEIMERNAQIENSSIDNVSQIDKVSQTDVVPQIDEGNRLKSSSLEEPVLTITEISKNIFNNRINNNEQIKNNINKSIKNENLKKIDSKDIIIFDSNKNINEQKNNNLNHEIVKTTLINENLINSLNGELIKSNIKNDFEQLKKKGRNYSYNFNVETTINTQLTKSKAKERQTFQRVDTFNGNIEGSIQLEDESIQLEEDYSNYDKSQVNLVQNQNLTEIAEEKISIKKKENDLFETFNENLEVRNTISDSLYPNTEINNLKDNKKRMFSKGLEEDFIYSDIKGRNVVKELNDLFEEENNKESVSRVNSINKRNSADEGFIKKSRFNSNKGSLRRNSYASIYSQKLSIKNKNK